MRWAESFRVQKCQNITGRPTITPCEYAINRWIHSACTSILKKLGWNMAPHFKGLKMLLGIEHVQQSGNQHLWTGKGENRSSIEPFSIHPAILGAAALLTWIALTKGATATIPSAAYSELTIVRASSVSRLKGSRSTECWIYTVDSDGILRSYVSSIETTAVSSSPNATV